MIDSNLALGVQACYRGPRLYDTDRTRDMVKERVAWFKQHRDILESDLIHGRRADGRDLDWMLHVNPALPDKGLLVIFNPTDHPIAKVIRVPLYYTGLRDVAVLHREGAAGEVAQFDEGQAVQVSVTVAPQSLLWYTITAQEQEN